MCLNLNHRQIQLGAPRQISPLLVLRCLWLVCFLFSHILSLCCKIHYFLQEEYLALNVLFLMFFPLVWFKSGCIITWGETQAFGMNTDLIFLKFTCKGIYTSLIEFMALFLYLVARLYKIEEWFIVAFKNVCWLKQQKEFSMSETWSKRLKLYLRVTSFISLIHSLYFTYSFISRKWDKF